MWRCTGFVMRTKSIMIKLFYIELFVCARTRARSCESLCVFALKWTSRFPFRAVAHLGREAVFEVLGLPSISGSLTFFSCQLLQRPGPIKEKHPGQPLPTMSPWWNDNRGGTALLCSKWHFSKATLCFDSVDRTLAVVTVYTHTSISHSVDKLPETADSTVYRDQS